MKLPNGTEIPQIGLGTWPMDDAEVADVIVDAAAMGYRLFDTAVNYLNEKGVGKGILRSSVPRDELLITTKVPGRDHGYDSTKQSLEGSLKRMGLDYLDLYLIHWPNPEDNKYVETWRAFLDLQQEGKVREIGVCNFKPAHIDRLIEETGVAPALNQIQLYPAVTQVESRVYNEQHGIITESWSPLGLGANAAYYGGAKTFLELPTITSIADTHGKTAAQVVLRWHIQLGLLPVPKSSNRTRLAENLDVFSFTLTAQEMAQLTALDDGTAEVADSDINHEY